MKSKCGALLGVMVLAGAFVGNSVFACTDFSGTWKGTCNEQGRNTPIQITLQQSDCAVLEGFEGDYFAGAYMVIGGKKTTTQTYPDGGQSVTVEMPGWNSDQTTLIFKTEYNASYPGSRNESFVSVSTFAMDGTTLVLSMTEDSKVTTCRMKK